MPAGQVSPDRLVVVDVETTGLYRTDRIVEIAMVTVDRSGTVLDEFDTLVNPGRDVGPTWIHRITASMVQEAPYFSEIAGHIAGRINGAVCVAHNLPFDTRMIERELEIAGVTVDWGLGIDTLRLTGCKLERACSLAGITINDHHRALADAHATAKLALALTANIDAGRPASATPIRLSAVNVHRREGRASVEVSEPFLARISHNVVSEPDIAPYVDLLGSALADLRLTGNEKLELANLAADLGLTPSDVARAHRTFFSEILDEALADEVVTDEEFDQLRRAAALLGMDFSQITQRTDRYRSRTAELTLSTGLRVCLTGSASRHDGSEISRDEAHTIVANYGLLPIERVSAKGCDLLVAVDLATQSRKIEHARRHRVPVASFAHFIRALENGTSLGVTYLEPIGVPLVCIQCGSSWIATRSSKTPICITCK